jgi:hypothetical protein
MILSLEVHNVKSNPNIKWSNFDILLGLQHELVNFLVPKDIFAYVLIILLHKRKDCHYEWSGQTLI